MIQRCKNEYWAVVEEATKRQSGPRHTPRKSQSNHERWLGRSSTGPGVCSTASLNALKRKSRRSNRRMSFSMGGVGAVIIPARSISAPGAGPLIDKSDAGHCVGRWYLDLSGRNDAD